MKLSNLLMIAISVFIYFSWINSYAEMPAIPCKSICPNTPDGGHCISIGEKKIYYRSLGSGKPTVIFSSGFGFPSDNWFASGIADKMAKKVKVFAYDRVYTFNSCPNQNNYMPVTAKDVVSQLRELLKHENISPPYILVGQSIGGLYMLLYAREYPEEIAGIVLMDASSDAGPTPLPVDAIPILKKLGNPQNASPDNPLYNEMIGQLPSYLQLKKSSPLKKNIPLIVMYATKHCLPITWTKKLLCMTPKQEAEHAKQQIEIYNMSTHHQLIRINGDHMSFFEPQNNAMVLKALNNIIKMSQKN